MCRGLRARVVVRGCVSSVCVVVVRLLPCRTYSLNKLEDGPVCALYRYGMSRVQCTYRGLYDVVRLCVQRGVMYVMYVCAAFTTSAVVRPHCLFRFVPGGGCCWKPVPAHRSKVNAIQCFHYADFLFFALTFSIFSPRRQINR